jgi:hypothetical protein
MIVKTVSAKQCYGFGAFSGIRDGEKIGSGMNIPNYFSKSLETDFRVINT